jgi:hypothetical protein
MARRSTSTTWESFCPARTAPDLDRLSILRWLITCTPSGPAVVQRIHRTSGPSRVVTRRVSQTRGVWCAVNFWRCRQAHCLFTGSGGLLLALFAVAEAGLGHSLIGGDEQLVFLGVLAIGLVVEGTWYLVHYGSASTPTRPG